MSELTNQANKILELARVLLSLRHGTQVYNLTLAKLESAVREMQRMLVTKH